MKKNPLYQTNVFQDIVLQVRKSLKFQDVIRTQKLNLLDRVYFTVDQSADGSDPKPSLKISVIFRRRAKIAQIQRLLISFYPSVPH